MLMDTIEGFKEDIPVANFIFLNMVCIWVGGVLARGNLKRNILRDIKMLRHEHSKSTSDYHRREIRKVVAKLHKMYDSL
jgi:hypothetical protein